jgi:hypothetical protein
VPGIVDPVVPGIVPVVPGIVPVVPGIVPVVPGIFPVVPGIVPVVPGIVPVVPGIVPVVPGIVPVVPGVVPVVGPPVTWAKEFADRAIKNKTGMSAFMLMIVPPYMGLSISMPALHHSFSSHASPH